MKCAGQRADAAKHGGSEHIERPDFVDSPSQRNACPPRRCPAFNIPRSSSLSRNHASHSSASTVGLCDSITRNKTATLKFSVASGRGTKTASTSRNVVFPQPFSGDEMFKRGEQRNDSKQCACAVHKASASASTVRQRDIAGECFRRLQRARPRHSPLPATIPRRPGSTCRPCNSSFCDFALWPLWSTSLSSMDARQPRIFAASVALAFVFQRRQRGQPLKFLRQILSEWRRLQFAFSLGESFNCGMSLKSVGFVLASANCGAASLAWMVFAASVAFVTPGLPSVN